MKKLYYSIAINQFRRTCFFVTLMSLFILFLITQPLLAQTDEATAGASSIGLSPAAFVVPNLLVNTAQSRTFTIFLDPSLIGEKLNFKLIVDSNNKEYLNIPNRITKEVGERLVKVDFEVNAKNAAEGDYTAIIHVVPDIRERTKNEDDSGAEESEMSATVSLGVSIPVQYHVTNREESSFEVLELTVRDTELNLPVLVSYVANNTGNVNWRPEKVVLRIKNADDELRTYEEEILSDELELVPAGETDVMIVRAYPELFEGNYLLTADIYSNGEIVFTSQEREFSVYPNGALKQSGTISSLSINKSEYETGERVRVSADFLNNGDIAVDVILATKFYRDGEFVQEITNRGIAVFPDEVVSLEEYFVTKIAGLYSAETRIVYGLFETETQELEFNVREPEQTLASFTSKNSQYITAIIIVLFSVLGVWIVWRLMVPRTKKELKKNKQEKNNKTKE